MERNYYKDTENVTNFKEWESKFDNADNDLKKAMLFKVIDKIYFGKNEVRISLNFTLQNAWIFR